MILTTDDIEATSSMAAQDTLSSALERINQTLAKHDIKAEVESMKRMSALESIKEAAEQSKQNFDVTEHLSVRSRNIIQTIQDLLKKARAEAEQSLKAVHEYRVIAKRVQERSTARSRGTTFGNSSGGRKTSAAKKATSASAAGGKGSGGGGGDSGGGGDGGDSDGPHRNQSVQKTRSSNKRNNSQRPPNVPPGAAIATSSPQFPHRPPHGRKTSAVEIIALLFIGVISFRSESMLLQCFGMLCCLVLAISAMGYLDLAKDVWVSGLKFLESLIAHVRKKA